MKTKNTRNMVVLGLILLMALGCTNYDDGPMISFRSPDKKVTSHAWYVKSFKKNDIDLTVEWKDNYDWGLEFKPHIENYPPSPTSSLYVIVNSQYYSYGFGGWHFHEIDFESDLYDKSKLVFWFNVVDTSGLQISDTIGIFPLNTRMHMEYEVIRLTTKEMWLQYEDGNDVYEIHFKE